MSPILGIEIDMRSLLVKITIERDAAKYTGQHSLRHFDVSWCINRCVDGGVELPLKLIPSRMGRASIQIMADILSRLES